MIGTIISGYRIVRQVGKGGMGVVYKAVNEQIARTTAIKVLNPRYCQDPETVQRLMNEARAVNIVGHPGLINIHEFGQLEDGSGYLIMEFLDGDTLRARLKSHGGRWWPGGVRAAQQIASTLAATHEHGIVHRDLKPDIVTIERETKRTVPRRGEVLADHGLCCGMMVGPTSSMTNLAIFDGELPNRPPTPVCPEEVTTQQSEDGRSRCSGRGNARVNPYQRRRPQSHLALKSPVVSDPARASLLPAMLRNDRLRQSPSRPQPTSGPSCFLSSLLCAPIFGP